MPRRPLSALIAFLLLLVLAPAQAHAATPSEVTAALGKAPLFVDPALADAVPAAKRRAVLRAIEAAPVPVFVALVPLTKGDRYGGDGRRFLDVVHGRLSENGVYVTAEEGLLKQSGFGIDEEKLQLSKASTVGNFESEDRDQPDIEKVLRFVKALGAPRLDARAQKVRDRLDARSGSYSVGPVRVDRGSRSNDDGAGWLGVLLVLAGLLVAGGLVLRWRRGRHARPEEEEPLIPRRIFEHARSAQAEELREDIEEQLVVFSEEIDKRPTPRTPGGTSAQQSGLDAYTAARRVLQSDPGMVDLVGALVLTHDGARALAEAQALEAGRNPPRPVRLCFFDPRHGAATGEIARGFAVSVPACAECRRALQAGGAPSPLLDDGEPWFESDSLWAKTGFGVFSDKLATRVLGGELRR